MLLSKVQIIFLIILYMYYFIYNLKIKQFHLMRLLIENKKMLIYILINLMYLHLQQYLYLVNINQIHLYFNLLSFQLDLRHEFYQLFKQNNYTHYIHIFYNNQDLVKHLQLKIKYYLNFKHLINLHLVKDLDVILQKKIKLHLHLKLHYYLLLQLFMNKQNYYLLNLLL